MTAGDMLGVGVSGLQVFQRSLSTIGQNISNVNTEGYSRQRVDLAARNPMPSGSGFIGNGVKVTTTERLFSEYSAEQVRQRTATSSFFDVLSEFASQVDNLVADPDAGLSPALNSFFDSIQEVANDPSSIPARNVMLTEAGSLVDRFKTMDSWFKNLQKATNDKITNQVETINETATSIAELNREIIVATGLAGGQPPNDLLDRRDHLIDELSQSISVSTVKASDGSVNVFIGKGQSLVLSTKTMKLTAINNPDDPQNKSIGYIDPNTGSASDVSTSLTGGDLGGALAFRSEVLQPAINNLGRLALGLATTFNDQQVKGLDLNSNLGTEFFDGFSMIPSLVTGDPDVVQLYATESINNTSTATITVGLDDISALTTDEYQISNDGGGNYFIKNMSTNNVQSLTIDSAGPPIEFAAFDGMQIQLSAAPAITDVFYIRPTRNPSGQINVAISDPNLIAAADPLKTNGAYATNLGSAEISEATIVDITDPDVLQSVRVIFSSSTGGTVADQFVIEDFSGTAIVPTQVLSDPNGYTTPPGPLPPGPPYAYPLTAGDSLLVAIEMNGYQLNISGEAFAGDQFEIEQNLTGVSDNRNALALANLQNEGTMIGGNATYNDAYSELVVLVGNKTNQAEVSFESQNALLTQAKGLKDALSGVNLDEEAANMLKFQQSYAAAAQVISAADQIFQTLINAVRR